MNAPERPDPCSEGQIFRDDESAAGEAQRHTERMARMIDYTPIGERDSPCLNGCMFNGEYGCMIYKSRIIDMVKCEKYKEWAVSKKIWRG